MSLLRPATLAASLTLLLLAPAACDRHGASVGGGRARAPGAAVDTATPATGAGGPSRPEQDALVLSFAWIGGCRVAEADVDPAHNPSTANVPELERTLADLAALTPMPRYLFFPGDLIAGMTSDGAELQAQLDAWTALYRGHPSGIAGHLTLVPLMGNHEALINGPHKSEVPNPVAGDVWLRWLARSGFDARGGNGPTNASPNPDALQDDERNLSYSFDEGRVHFVVLDTDSWTTTPDPATGSTQIGWVPIHWLTADLAAAEANPAVQNIFVLGHKPLTRPSGQTSADQVINPAMNSAMIDLLDAHPKVKGYLTSHDHLWDARQLPGRRGVWQIISGNGGSPLDPAWAVEAPYFGFTVVNVYASGRVDVVPYGRPAPKKYDDPVTAPAIARPELTIAGGH